MRRSLLFIVIAVFGAAAIVLLPRPAGAFGDQGAFDPRVLLTGNQTGAAHASAPARWSWELIQRTSAPARPQPTVVRADDPHVVDAPFLYWSGESALAPLTAGEVSGLRKLLLARWGPARRRRGARRGRRAERLRPRGAHRDRARPPRHAAHRPRRRPRGLPHLLPRCAAPRAASKARRRSTPSCAAAQAQVLFSEHDLGGALARGPTGVVGAPRRAGRRRCSASAPSGSR